MICTETFFIDCPISEPSGCELECPGDAFNLVENGDFEAGDVGFNSSLTSNCSCAFATYCVTTDATLKCNNSFWDPVLASSGTNYMVIDGSVGSVWSQSINVNSGQTYLIAFDFYPDISGSPSPTLGVYVNGNLVLGNIIGTLGEWTTFCEEWTATTTGPVTLEIRQENSVGFDDYGLDNIRMEGCCDISVSLPDTLVACENDPVQFHPVVTGAIGPVTYTWAPVGGLDDPTIEDPIATPGSNTLYTLTVTDSVGCSATTDVFVSYVECPCDNIVVNGDFESGNTGFTSDLTNSCTCGFSSYCIAPNARDKCTNGFWQSIYSPTPGNYMIVDGLGAGGTVWEQTVTVVDGYVYDFCFDYYPNVSGDPNPELTILIDGTPVFSTTGTSGSWQKICYNGWPAPTGGGPIQLEIRQTTNAGFDDYGIDNIQFGTCCELTVALPDTMTVCFNDTFIEPVQFHPVVAGAIGPVTYQWTPSTGLSATNIADPIATPGVQTAYTLTVTDSLGCEATATVVVDYVDCPCNNLVVNGDFESGNTGFTSGLSNNCTCAGNSYCISGNARDKCTNGFWQSIYSPSGTGNYMIIDGFGSNGTVWSQNVTVVGGYVYDFCFDYYPNVSGDPSPQLSVWINGSQVLTTTGTSGAWQKICLNGWQAPAAGGIITLEIRQDNSVGFDDYGIDNIQFGSCCELSVGIPPVDWCPGESVTLIPSVGGVLPPSSETYLWTPATDLSSATAAQPVATPSGSTATYNLLVTDGLGCQQTATVNLVGISSDLVVNGDFESGNTGFLSDLPLDCTCQANSYCVAPNAQNKCTNSLWQPITSPSGPGNYLIVDGSGASQGDAVWYNSYNLTAGELYDFCMDFYPDISGGGVVDLSIEVYSMAARPPYWALPVEQVADRVPGVMCISRILLLQQQALIHSELYKITVRNTRITELIM